MYKISPDANNDVTTALKPTTKAIDFVNHSFIRSKCRWDVKSCMILELIAHNSELAVDMIAARIAQMITINIHSGHIFARTNTNGFPRETFTDFNRAKIPKYRGTHERIIKSSAVKNAEIVAVAFDFAAKNFWPTS